MFGAALRSLCKGEESLHCSLPYPATPIAQQDWLFVRSTHYTAEMPLFETLNHIYKHPWGGIINLLHVGGCGCDVSVTKGIFITKVICSIIYCSSSSLVAVCC
jgi:hypothetical protein